MNSTRQTLLLAKRELLQRVQTKAFIVTMALLVGLVLVSGPLISLIDAGDKPINVGLVGTEPGDFETDFRATATAFETQVTLTRYDAIGEAETALEHGDIDVVLVDASELVFHEDERFFTAQVIKAALTVGQQRDLLDELGATSDHRTRLQESVTLSSRTVVEPAADEDARRVAAYLSLLVLYIAILVFGQFVAMGTVQEKQNRVVEVVLSKVRSSQVLISKVLGIGLLGIGQLLALGLAGIVTVSFVDSDLSLPSIGLGVLGGALLWFILGYTLYAFMYAALGATVSRQEDLQGVLMVPLLLLVPGYLVAQVATTNPSGTLAVFGSFFPFWSPMIMPSRYATGHASTFDVGLSIGLVLIVIWVLIKVGARVYEGALLRTGGRVSVIEAWKSART